MKMWLREKMLMQLIKSGGKCWYCGKKITFEDSNHNPDGFSVDHFIPRCNEGTDNEENLIPCCFECNACKGRKSDIDLFRWRLVKRDLVKKYPNVGLEKFSGSNIKTIFNIWGDRLRIKKYEFHFEKKEFNHERKEKLLEMVRGDI